MKKQKFMKLTAFASTPSLENSFSAPGTHNGEISVVFSGKNAKIHGWDGSAWSVIYTWNSVDKQHTFNNTFESYFLESLTGGDETMGVSFFSVSRYQGSTPTLAGVNREVKLHDVDEVPIYTASDAGKMLTIMSDGSLRWLGASVTWMIDGSPVPVTVGAGSGIEDSGGVTLQGTATLNDGVLSFDGAGYGTISDGFRYTDNMTVSVWFKSSATGDRRILSSHIRSGSPIKNGWLLYLNNGRLDFFEPSFSANTYTITGPSGMNDGQWHHVAMTWAAGGTWSLYVDGVEFKTGASGAQTPAYMSGWDLYVGANGWNGSNPYGLFVGEIDNIQIENQTMTEAEVLSIYNAGRVETPIQEPIVGLEDEPSLVLVNGAQYANGELTLSRSLSQYAYLADNDDYDYTGTDMTISGKFKMNGGLSLGDQTIFSKLTGKTPWDGYVINLMQSGDFRYYLGINGNNNANSWDTPISVNTEQWYSFSLVIRPSKNISLWFDGVNIDNRTVGELAANVVQPLVFGALWTNDPGYTNFFDGSLKDFKIHKRELTSEEIMSLHNGSGISETINSYSETIVLDENGQTFVRANRDVLNLGDDPSYDRVDGEDFAVEGEFKLASTYGSATWDIVGKGQTSGWWGWAVMIYGGVIRMFAHSSGTAASGHGMNATFSPVVGQWYHFKAIWKADGKQEMWVDGVKLAERTVTSSGYFPPVDTAYDLQIGEVFTNSVRNFDGDIRNVKIQSGTIN